VRKARRLNAERLAEHELDGGVGDVVLAAQDVREVVEANDKKLKATRDYQEQLAKIARAEAAGVTTLPGGAAFDATKARADALREYQDKLAKANEEGQKAAKLADDQAAKVAKVSEALAVELDRQTRLTEAQRQGSNAVAALNVALEIEKQLREAGIPAIEKRTAAQQREAEAIEGTVRQIEAQRAAYKSAQDDQKKLDDARRSDGREGEAERRQLWAWPDGIFYRDWYPDKLPAAAREAALL
jgi:hypothetical protein